MNSYKRFPQRTMQLKNPKFGARYYLNGHRYVYYVDKKPRYYFSDRPYTLDDARKWKKRTVFWLIVFDLIIGWTVFSCFPGMDDLIMLLLYLVVLGMFVVGVIYLIFALPLNPEKDPMLESYICTSDFKRPDEVICNYCGGVYADGAHEVCPHCKISINS